MKVYLHSPHHHTLTYHREQVRRVNRTVTWMISCLFLVHHGGHSQAEVGPKGVDGHGPAHIGSLEDKGVQGLIGRVEHDLKEGDDDHLEGTGLPQDGAKRNENRGCTEVCQDQPVCVCVCVFVCMCVFMCACVLCTCV